jgi:16S rRNA (cytidine1402-2'-O)-methyltransferase
MALSDDRKSGKSAGRFGLDPHPARGFRLGGQEFPVEPVAAGLHVVATPIGNLADITIRALATLAGVSVILAEDTRVTRVLLDRYGIRTRLMAHHAHNESEATQRALALLAEGKAVALVTDAGTPLVSDPGHKLVAAAREAGNAVTGAPGPSAVIAALAIVGLPTERFFFEGFLPAKTAARRARLVELATIPATLVFYEAPHRLADMLADAAFAMPGREAALARELTKFHEEVLRGDVGELASNVAARPALRGEIVVLIGPPAADGAAVASVAGDLDARLEQALAATTLKQAVANVAAATGQPRRLVYARALALTGKR